MKQEVKRWVVGTKGELRNKWSQLAFVVPCSAIVLALPSGAGAVSALMLMVIAIAGAMAGGKEWGSGRKLVGLVWFVLGLILFLISGGYGFMADECRRAAKDATEMAICSKQSLEWPDETGKQLALMILALAVVTTAKRKGESDRRKTNSFVERHSIERDTLRPERWYTKERDFERFVLAEFTTAKVGERQQYEWLCDVTDHTPEPHDLESDYRRKCVDMLSTTPWHSVYEMVERGYSEVGFLHAEEFTSRINDYLRDNRVGWRLETGSWTKVGDEVGEGIVAESASAAARGGCSDSSEDIATAWELVGTVGRGNEKEAVVRAIRGLEGVMQETQGSRGQRLDRISLPECGEEHEQLNKVKNSLYRYASEMARHAKEGSKITKNEAAFVVTISAGLVRFLLELPKQR